MELLIGSDEERVDLLKAYEDHKGSLDAIFEHVMVSNPLDDEERFCEILDAAIQAGEVKAYPAYRKETKASKKRRRVAAEKEANEAEEYAKELGVHDALFAEGSEPKEAAKGKGRRKKAAEDTSGLEALIRSRNSNRMDDMIQNLEAKYGGSKTKKRKVNTFVEPDEEAFLKTRRKLGRK